MSASLFPLFLSPLLFSVSVYVCVYVCAQITVTVAAKGYCWLWQLCLSFRILYILSLLFYKEKIEAASDIHRDRYLKKRKREAETAYRQNYLLFLYPSALPGCHFTPSLASYNEFGWCSSCYWRSHYATVGLAL